MTASTSLRSQPAALASARMLLSHLLLACHCLSATHAFAATRRPLAPPRQPPRRAVAAAATKTRYKRVSLDFIEFGAELSLDAAVRGGGDAAALGAFLTPARVVGAAWKPGQDKGDSTSLQRECSARARSGKSIHASRPFREMIARPKISRNEWKPAERGAFEVGNFAPLSCPGRRRRSTATSRRSGASSRCSPCPRASTTSSRPWSTSPCRI